MRGKRKAALFIGCVTLGMAAQARAQTTLHAEGTASLNYTNNLRFASSHPLPGQPGPISAYFLTLSPGAFLVREAPRATYILRYSHPMTLYLRDESTPIHADMVSASGLFALSAVDELILGASASRTKTYTMTLNQAPSENAAAVQPANDMTIGAVGASEAYSHSYSQRWRALQTLDGSMLVPIDTPTAQSNRLMLNGVVGVEHVSEPNAYALLARANYFYMPQAANGAQVVSARQEHAIGGLTGRWRRDLGRDFSSELSLGMVRAARVDALGKGYYAVAGAGALRYNEERGSVELMYSRDVMPTLLTGQTFMFDRLHLSGSKPIQREWHLLANAGMGLSMNRILDMEDGHQRGSAKNYVADCSISWAPPEAGISTALRYQYTKQDGESNVEAPLPSFSRHTVMLTVGGSYPTRELPRIPNANRGRVDGTDRPANMREPDFRDRERNRRPQGG